MIIEFLLFYLKIGRLPLGRQIDYFQETRNKMSGQIGENATSELLKKAIFSIAAGSNDILNYLQPSIPFLQGDKVPPSVLQETMLSNLTSYLKVFSSFLIFYGSTLSYSVDNISIYHAFCS